MSDRLKKTIDKQRPEFDIYETDIDQLWPDIEEGIQKRQKTVEIKWLWRVAAAFVVGVGLTIMINTLNQASIEGDQLAYEISPEWAETEQYYAVKIDEKLTAIKTSQIELDPLILEDISLLDQAYTELKDDLSDGADNEEVINAMISNYQIKLEILERILIEINEKQEHGSEESYEL